MNFKPGQARYSNEGRLEKRSHSETNISILENRSCEQRNVATQLSFDMKEKDVVNGIVPAASTSLPEEANKAISVVFEALKSVFVFYIVDFRNFIEIHEDVSGELLEVKVDVFLTDPTLRAT